MSAHILIVDDDASISEMLRQYLEHTGYAVSWASDGDSGLQKMLSENYDLVLLDWRMPGKDGIEVLKSYRMGNQITPIIMVTGQQSVDEKELGFEAGANDYVTKPYHLKELVARIRALLKRQELIKPLPAPLGKGNDEILQAGNLVGTTLAAKYEFVELLGKGAFGLVFKAHHPYLRKTVAVKMVQAKNLTDELIKQFHIEARAASALNHPNVVVIHDFGVTENQQPFMVMELIEGEALDKLLERQLYLPFDAAKTLLLGVCEGLAHAHEMGVVHRDMKPANIIVRRGKNSVLSAKIVDFGLAQFGKMHSRQGAINGYIAGSPLYMPPEIFKGEFIDQRSDIYAFGCVMFEMLTGRVAVDGGTIKEVIYNHVNSPPLTLRQVRPDLKFPDGLQEILDATLQKSPDKRFQSAEQLCAALRQVADRRKRR